MSLHPRILRSLAIGLARVFPRYFAGKIRRPIFIVGINKTGKTLFANLICERMPGVIKYPAEANREVWFSGLYPWHEATTKVPPDFIDPEAFFSAAIASLRGRNTTQIKAIFGAYQWLSGKEHVINDNGMLIQIIDEVFSVFPDALFIHVRRDATATGTINVTNRLAKVRKHPKYRREGYSLSEDEMHQRLDGLRERALATMAAFQERCEIIPGVNFLECDFESILARPDQNVQEVMKLIESAPAKDAQTMSYETAGPA